MHAGMRLCICGGCVSLSLCVCLQLNLTSERSCTHGPLGSAGEDELEGEKDKQEEERSANRDACDDSSLVLCCDTGRWLRSACRGACDGL